MINSTSLNEVHYYFLGDSFFAGVGGVYLGASFGTKPKRKF
jgi:hypothetical protein